jgi:hypothetical protein
LTYHRKRRFSGRNNQVKTLAGTSPTGTQHEAAFLSVPVPKLHGSIDLFRPKAKIQRNVTMETQKQETLYESMTMTDDKAE